MALWQYDTYLIPQSRLLERFGSIPVTVTDEQAQSLHWNAHHQPPTDYAAHLSAFLKPAGSWHEDVQIWGSDLGNRVDVTRKADGVQTMRVRFDARECSASPFLIRIVDWAQYCAGVFLTDEAHVVPPGVRPLLADMRQSPARRFAIHPKYRHLSMLLEEESSHS
jgi:hypothetical protein